MLSTQQVEPNTAQSAQVWRWSRSSARAHMQKARASSARSVRLGELPVNALVWHSYWRLGRIIALNASSAWVVWYSDVSERGTLHQMGLQEAVLVWATGSEGI